MPKERRQHARLNAPQGAIWRRIGHRISNPAVEGSNPSGSVSLRRIRVNQPVDAFHPCPCPTKPALSRGGHLSFIAAKAVRVVRLFTLECEAGSVTAPSPPK